MCTIIYSFSLQSAGIIRRNCPSMTPKKVYFVLLVLFMYLLFNDNVKREGKIYLWLVCHCKFVWLFKKKSLAMKIILFYFIYLFIFLSFKSFFFRLLFSFKLSPELFYFLAETFLGWKQDLRYERQINS